MRFCRLKKTKKTALTPPSQIRMIPPHQGKTNMRLDKTTIEKNNAEMTKRQKIFYKTESPFSSKGFSFRNRFVVLFFKTATL
jgi:hypothetical protein